MVALTYRYLYRMSNKTKYSSVKMTLSSSYNDWGIYIREYDRTFITAHNVTIKRHLSTVLRDHYHTKPAYIIIFCRDQTAHFYDFASASICQ